MLTPTRFVFALAVSLFVLAGAARADDVETGTVEGKVTLDGKPLAKGKVVFHPAKGKAIEAETKEDGSYTAKDVPVGKTPVTIALDGLLPPRYSDPKKTELTFEVKKGKNTADFDLKSN
jgi:hypothetical protein